MSNDFFDGVCRGADQAVVKGEPDTVGRGEMRVNDLRIGAVCLTQCAKQSLGLHGDILSRSDGNQLSVREQWDLLVVAKDGAMLAPLR